MAAINDDVRADVSAGQSRADGSDQRQARQIGHKQQGNQVAGKKGNIRLFLTMCDYVEHVPAAVSSAATQLAQHHFNAAHFRLIR